MTHAERRASTLGERVIEQVHASRDRQVALGALMHANGLTDDDVKTVIDPLVKTKRLQRKTVAGVVLISAPEEEADTPLKKALALRCQKCGKTHRMGACGKSVDLSLLQPGGLTI